MGMLPSRLRIPGKPSTVSEPDWLRALRAEYEAKNRKLTENLLDFDNLLSPLEWADAGGGFGPWRMARPVDRTMDRSHAPINYLNETEWRFALAAARDLCVRNHLALGLRDHVSNFIGPVTVAFVLRGQAPGANSTGPEADVPVDPLVKAAQQCWDEWTEIAEWGQGEHDREEECRKRLIVEGECTLRFFAGNDDTAGLPLVRHIEPELIRTPPGHSTIDTHGWGVICDDLDDELERGVWVCHYANVSEGKVIPVSEYVRLKANVDRTVKRGFSDFFPVAEQLRKIMGLLENCAHVGRLQAAIAWWEQYPTATQQQVSQMIQAGADYQRSKLPPNQYQGDSWVTNHEPGTIYRTEQRDVKPGPVSTGADAFAKVEEMVLQAVCFRWGLPSYILGASESSFASTLVEGAPFVRAVENRQKQVMGFTKAVAHRVIEFCERTGRLPKGTSRRVRPTATAKPVVIADEEKQARTFLALYDKNCADPVEYIRGRKGDPKVVAANILAWKKKFPEAGQGAPGGPGGPNGPAPGAPPGPAAPPGAAPAPKDPTPAPPGSAGGDGSSPNEPDDIFGEGRRVAEGPPGPPPHEGLVWNDTTHRWHNPQTGEQHVPLHIDPAAVAAHPPVRGAVAVAARFQQILSRTGPGSKAARVEQFKRELPAVVAQAREQFAAAIPAAVGGMVEAGVKPALARQVAAFCANQLARAIGQYGKEQYRDLRYADDDHPAPAPPPLTVGALVMWLHGAIADFPDSEAHHLLRDGTPNHAAMAAVERAFLGTTLSERWRTVHKSDVRDRANLNEYLRQNQPLNAVALHPAAEGVVREEQGTPPFAGAVFDKARHRWVKGPDATAGALAPPPAARRQRDAAAARQAAVPEPARTANPTAPRDSVMAKKAPRSPDTDKGVRAVSIAHRRRALHGLRNEAELSTAIDGHNLPDSEPADVIHLVDADGKPITDHEVVRTHMKLRRDAVEALKTGKYPHTDSPLTPEARAGYEARLSIPAHFFEVKTLVTSPKHSVHMSRKAMDRKMQYMARYGITFHTVAIDDRKGAKHSGHRIYVIPNAFGGTVRLDQMQKVDSMADVLKTVQGAS